MSLLLLIAIFSIFLFYYLHFLYQISKGIKVVSENIEQVQSYEYISVIIPFRNEEKNLIKSIKSITSQTLSKEKYEVIYIDDNSDDKGFELLKKLRKPENIILLKSPAVTEKRGHKKIALQEAMRHSKGEIIITTDADCTHTREWLETMSGYFGEDTGFVSGPVQFHGGSSLFKKLQELEFSSLILVGAGLIGINFPIICNAANLGFRKSVYEEVGGYRDNLTISSGDDEFLMQKIAMKTKYKIKFCFNREAMTFTHSNDTIKQLYNQRKRWASKGLHYVDKRITLKLVLIFIFYLSIPAKFIMGLLYSKIFFITFLIWYLLKIIFEYKILFIDSRNLFQKQKFMNFLIAEILHVPFIIIAGLSGLFGNYNWKSRKIVR